MGSGLRVFWVRAAETELSFGWGDRTGAYDEEEAAARAYDLAALKYWGPGTVINFKVRSHTLAQPRD